MRRAHNGGTARPLSAAPHVPAMRVTGLLVALLALAMTSALPPAEAQGHEHGAVGPTILAHDGPVDGRQFAGNLAHFAAIAHGDDAVPDFHQDVPMRVTLDGVVLFETTPDSGHDYDGVNVLDVVFPHAGRYKVEALDASGAAIDSFEGEVLPAPALQARLGTSEPMDVLAGVPVTYGYTVREAAADGAQIDHSDCWFEVLLDGATLLRTKTHTHREEQQLQVTFPAAGTYDVRFTCFQAYPSANATLFAPFAVERSIGVGAGPPLPLLAGPSVNDGQQAMPPTALNAVVTGAAGGDLLLVGTFDPYTIVGPDTLQHLNVLAVDPATGTPRQHVDFEATLTAPGGGVLFASATLHEYDGIYELATRNAVPGLYTLEVWAEAGSWRDRVLMQWLVAPPVAPTSAGPVGLVLDQGSPRGGDPGAYLFSATAAAGPFAHGEIELQVFGASPVPLLRTKLHTHDDGTFPFTLALPEGPHRFDADPFPLMPEAVVVEAASFTVPVAPAAAASGPEDAPAEQAAPAAPVALLALALAALVLARRR